MVTGNSLKGETMFNIMEGIINFWFPPIKSVDPEMKSAYVFTVDRKPSPTRYYVEASDYCEFCTRNSCHQCAYALNQIIPTIEQRVPKNMPYFAICSPRRWEDVYHSPIATHKGAEA